MKQATVLIPTFDHGLTLRESLRSVQAQTISDIEILVVGDGAPDITRELMKEFTGEDSRIKFFDNPKGPRHGEIHRHEALKHASGKIICYLADDDLYLPDHIETQAELLKDNDFSNILPLYIELPERIVTGIVDFSIPYFRKNILSGVSRIPLSAMAHTLDIYRKLPYGWRTTPDGIYTDLYMVQQFLAMPGLRAVSSQKFTVIKFPEVFRRGWSMEQRVSELEEWSHKLKDESFLSDFREKVIESMALDRAVLESSLRDHIEGIEGELKSIKESAAWKTMNSIRKIGPVRKSWTKIKNLRKAGPSR